MLRAAGESWCFCERALSLMCFVFSSAQRPSGSSNREYQRRA
jgi:hypothetical protein